MRKTITTGVNISRTLGERIPERSTVLWQRNPDVHEYNLVALMPVWNGEMHLVKALQSLMNCVDAVIALDDGSTDQTSAILKSFEIVREILTKPEKPLNHWHDGRNRYELYSAAQKYNPKWILCIDSDEILDSEFPCFAKELMNQDDQIKAYAFNVLDISEKEVIRERYGHRMYKNLSNSVFDMKRLHCRLVPLQITPDEVRLTNLNIYHVADLPTRIKRYNKYLLADPSLNCQSSYEHLLTPLVSNPIPLASKELILKCVVDDGLQRRLKARSISQDNIIFPELQEKYNKKLALYFDEWQPVEVLFQSFNLDAFFIERVKGKWVAQYSYSDSRDTEVTELQGWFVEEMHHHRDFRILLSRLMFTFSFSIKRAIREAGKTLSELKLKGIVISRT